MIDEETISGWGIEGNIDALEAEDCECLFCDCPIDADGYCQRITCDRCGNDLRGDETRLCGMCSPELGGMGA